MKVLCAFGQHNYGDISRGESPEYSAFIPALKSLGHEVDFIDTWNRHCYSDLACLNIELIRRVKSFGPDILFTVQMNYEIWMETIHLIRFRDGVTALTWATDDSWKYREVSRFIAGSYNYIITTYPYMVSQYKADGIDNVKVSQWAAISSNLCDPEHSKSCKYDVTFIGTAHGSRLKIIDALRIRGINVVCFGYGWPNGPISSSEISRIIRQSRISLNFANSKGDNQIKARVFEVPGAGGFLLTEIARDLEKYYVMDEEIGVFSDFENLFEKINYYLANPNKRDSIAQAGFLRTRNEHTYEHRFMEFLSSNSVVSNRKNSDVPYVNFDEVIARHKISPLLKYARDVLWFFGVLVFGKKRGGRAIRRFIYEISWRVAGSQTFTASGLPGRLFPHD